MSYHGTVCHIDAKRLPFYTIPRGRPTRKVSIVDNTHQFFWEAKETNRLFCCNINPSETHKAIYRVEMTSFLVYGWTNPLEKYVRQNGFIVPNFWGENKKYLSCHHPVMFLSWTPTKNQQITSPSVKKIPILIFPTFRLATSFPSSMLKGFSNSGISQNVPSFHSSSSIIQPLLSLVSPSLPLAVTNPKIHFFYSNSGLSRPKLGTIQYISWHNWHKFSGSIEGYSRITNHPKLHGGSPRPTWVL